jgi:mannose-6-phosphate isomerase-like protein (cupin superfamily)
MKVIKDSDLNWSFNESENVNIGFVKDLAFSGFDIIHARISPKQSLKMHYHDRRGGDEVFCFFKGGYFKIITKYSEREFRTKKPVYVSFSDGEAHSVENLSEDVLEFQAFYAPPFEPGEVKH